MDRLKIRGRKLINIIIIEGDLIEPLLVAFLLCFLDAIIHHFLGHLDRQFFYLALVFLFPFGLGVFIT